jgi:hypothetical protein
MARAVKRVTKIRREMTMIIAPMAKERAAPRAPRAKVNLEKVAGMKTRDWEAAKSTAV